MIRREICPFKLRIPPKNKKFWLYITNHILIPNAIAMVENDKKVLASQVKFKNFYISKIAFFITD